MTQYFKDFHTRPAPVVPFVPPARTYQGRYLTTFKRVFDLVLVLITAPFALILVAVAAALVARDGAKPIYHQERMGRNGRIFRVYKLRTMVPNADHVLESYLSAHPELRSEWDSSQKLRKDPRITPLGRLLRKTSIDELPQLFNVLKGEMSMIGPRPFMVKQARLYEGRAYYHLRPGITGLWQVSDRNECSFAERAAFDDTYYARASFGYDLAILARTVLVVLRCTGH